MEKRERSLDFLMKKSYVIMEREVEKSKQPTPLASGAALVSGEIPRETPYEKGLPPNSQYAKISGEIRQEPLIPMISRSS